MILPPGESYDEAAQKGVRAPTGGDGGDPDRPNGPPSSYPAIPPLDALRIAPAELDAARLTPVCIVESYLYCDVAAFPGPGGTGKTTLTEYEAVHIALGRPLYGLMVCTPPGTVVIVTAEDRRELLIARLVRIMEAMDLSAEDRAIAWQ